jgi:TIR domain
MTRTANKPAKVFCSYSHKNEEDVNQLRDWLRPLERQGLIQWWYDREIAPGWEWDEAIDKNLRTADVILLLVTYAFMASDYVYEKEIGKAVERHERGEARVIPIIVRPADWEWAPFAKLQALPKDAKPITTWLNQDEAWLDVVRGIRRAVQMLTQRLDREHMVLELRERGLEIYLTGPDVKWEKDPRLKYKETDEGYNLSGFSKDALKDETGNEFKHFVVCDNTRAERRRIERILQQRDYAITGKGDKDDEPHKWRIWFLIRDYPATKGYEDPDSNNLWVGRGIGP